MIKIQLNSPFFTKMAEARRLEREALMSLLPESLRGHVAAIEKEITAMAAECLLGAVALGKTPADTKKRGVKKVTIG